MYASAVSIVLICMIVTGAARSVAVKLFYQLGFDSPLFVTLLYLLGQSLSLIVYIISAEIKGQRHAHQALSNIPEDQNYVECTEYELSSNIKKLEEEQFDPALLLSGSARQSSIVDKTISLENEDDITAAEASSRDNRNDALEQAIFNVTDPGGPPMDGLRTHKHRGSRTGLSAESSRAVNWVHSIPWYLKPVMPGFCNLCNSAMRWGSLIYISASIAEILISGTELVLSVFAARLIRKRLVSKSRWCGVGIVTLGLVLVAALNLTGSSTEGTSMEDSIIGLLLVVGQCIMSVVQDITEEVFMDEADFPATLLLGMEGLFGLVFGLLLYWPLASVFGEDLNNTWGTLTDSEFNTLYAIFLPFLFTLTGIFNIMATGATSSMTRNVWKNMRTVLVWIFSLAIYYGTGNTDLGEPWVVPDSFYIMCGFGVMLAGIYVYYSHK